MEWIRTKRSLPELGERCVIRTDCDEYRVAKFFLINRSIPAFIASRHDVYPVIEVTHWARFEAPTDI